MQVGRFLVLTVALCLVATAVGATLERPVTVSPGGLATVEMAPTACPTFSWGAVDRARSYEIVVYALSAAEGPAESVAGRNPALNVTVTGSASSWTPAADRCLAGGSSFVWFVRAHRAGDAVSEWSEGGMFRTPAVAGTTCSREELLKIVERLLAGPTGARPSVRQDIARPPVIESIPSAGRFGSSLSRRVAAPPSAPETGQQAFMAEQSHIGGTPTYAVFGISHGSYQSSAGVVGYTTATSGEVAGVAGFNDSVQGHGVFALNSGTTGGVGLMARDEAGSGITSGVVGLTSNSEGYGGFFWNEDGGDALVVADPTLHPASVDVKLFVDVDGNLGLVGVVKFEPTDWPTESCDEATEGSIYYDASDHWLCVCTRTGSGPDTWGYRRADDPTDDCASPAP